MYLHKENRELFRDAILLTSQKLEVSEDIVEKDYYVTMILKRLSECPYPFPTEEKQLENYIFNALGNEEKDFIKAYDLGTFPMRVQSLNRTLIDKIFAVCDYYLQGKAHRNARHLYDIYKLSEHIVVDQKFLQLVEEVREHRISMGKEIAPAADFNIDILEVVQKICDEDFYKNDYKETTIKLISDSLTYEEAKNHYKKLVEKIF